MNNDEINFSFKYTFIFLNVRCLSIIHIEGEDLAKAFVAFTRTYRSQYSVNENKTRAGHR